MSRHYIEVGNVVSVNFIGAHFSLAHRAEVLSVPCATGDSWVFRNVDTGAIHYVSEGCTVTLADTRKADAYAKANPLGGPAAMFEVMAQRIRAGEPLASVLEDYGLAWVAKEKTHD